MLPSQPEENLTPSPVRASNSGAQTASTDREQLPDALLAIVDEHKYVARLLPLLEAEAENLLAEKEVDLECVEDVMHYMVHFPDRYHHPKEDLIFDRMSGLDDSTAKTVAKLRKDHQAMAVQAKQVLEKVEADRHKKSSSLEKKLGEELKQYVQAMREHMQLEESKVLRPAADSLGAADWEAIDREIEPIVDPIFGSRIKQRYVRLMQRYVNNFVAIADSGSFPIRAVESSFSALEQAIYTAFDFGGLLKKAVGHGAGAVKTSAGRVGELLKVRSRAEFDTWKHGPQVEQVDDEENWEALVEQFRGIMEGAGKPKSALELGEDISTVHLRTEKELLAYQEKPFRPEEEPRTSWQAAVLNVFMRMTLKILMGNVKIDSSKPNRFSGMMKADYVHPGTVIESLEDRGFHAHWIKPEKPVDERGVVLYLPGGGFLAPASNKHRKMLGKMVCNTQRPVLLVNYRLLPEHPFPAGLEDALAAYRYLLEEGVRAEDIVLGGDSAGGTLSLALMIAARDEGLPLPHACMLLSPLTDLSFSTGSRTSNRWKDPLLPSIRKGGAYEIYAGEHAIDDPLVSPIFGSYEGFPPTLALVSSTETLLDDTLVVARKARTQGVDFEVEVWHSLPHAWPIFSFLPEAELAVERLSKFVNESLSHTRAAAGPGGE